MSRNFQSFQSVVSFAPFVPGQSAVHEPITNFFTCGRFHTSPAILDVFGSRIASLRLPRFSGDVRVSKVIINEIQDIEGIGTLDLILGFLTKDINGNFAKTEFKYLTSDSGAKSFTLSAADLSLIPEDLVSIETYIYFGTDPTEAGAATCLAQFPSFGKLRTMITYELPRA